MNEIDKQWLADFSLVVRESTLKRLRVVPNGLENWRYKEGKMSFSDLAYHLIECDNWMFETLNQVHRAPIRESHFTSDSRMHYDGVVDDLVRTGQKRASLIRSYAVEDYSRMIHDPRIGQQVTAWWLIVRGNLDHEIHHRGQMSILLNLVE